MQENYECKKKEDKKAIPIYKKLLLSVDEAAAYSGIGTKKIRELMHDYEKELVLCVGKKHMIRREEFERFLAHKYVV